ncbi:MAG: hypothetical protein Q9N34_00260 [Aquificota bacterium]|nr:hypothetical protein [Aquificota bacterium]
MPTIAFVILGYYAYRNIPVDRFPDVDFPMVTVITALQQGQPHVGDTTSSQGHRGGPCQHKRGGRYNLQEFLRDFQGVTVVFDLGNKRHRDVRPRRFGTSSRGLTGGSHPVWTHRSSER